MRRLLCLVLLAASLLGQPRSAGAQADPGDKLSLEALTAPQPGDGQGYHGRRSYTRHAASRSYRGGARSHAARYHRAYGGYRRSYSGHRRRTTRSYRHATPYRSR